MSFAVNDKVVCVDCHREPNKDRPSDYPAPQKGVIYVVRDVWYSSSAEKRKPETRGILIQLVGFPEIFTKRHGLRMGFNPLNFRKLTEIQAENRLKASQPQEATP